MGVFVCKSYSFDHTLHEATFSYEFRNGQSFTERIRFRTADEKYDVAVLDKALFLSFVLCGVSYYKTFPDREIEIKQGGIDARQAEFFTHVYQEGLGQFAFENSLKREDLAVFHPSLSDVSSETNDNTYSPNDGVIALQSGGKDSIVTACLLEEKGIEFSSMFVSSSGAYPEVLDQLPGSRVLVVDRHIDIDALQRAKSIGGLNGHVPVTYIIQSFAIIQSILLSTATVYTSIAHEGEEPHSYIGDLTVNHQWSKTWGAEQLFSDYVARYISGNITIGSPLRSMSELKVSELFSQKAWKKYGNKFSSCNVANYNVGHDASELQWCGNCPKCANAYVLFAPFVDASELRALFGGKDLYRDKNLQQTFMGLFAVGDIQKPFECIGEVDELRYAYWLSQEKGGYNPVDFEVPHSTFDYEQTYESAVRI